MTDLKPGRELDALIAEKVFGLINDAGLWKDKTGTTLYWPDTQYFDDDIWLPEYSTDIAAAWTVVEELTSNEYIELEISPSKFNKEYQVSIKFEDKDGDEYGPFYLLSKISAPHAISLAALKAVGSGL